MTFNFAKKGDHYVEKYTQENASLHIEGAQIVNSSKKTYHVKAEVSNHTGTIAIRQFSVLEHSMHHF